MASLTLAIDAIGGDIGPSVTVPASLKALSLYPELSIILVGNRSAIEPFLIGKESMLHRLRIVSPQMTLTRQEINKNHRTIRTMLELVKDGLAQGCVSAGNTKSIMALAKKVLKPLDSILRPALMTILPHRNCGGTVMLDLGANVNCSSDVLVQFSIIGSIVANKILGVEHPRIALLNIGRELSKGTEIIRQTASVLKKLNSLNFVGYVEGNELLAGKADVLVCDGFTGNVALKTMEGVLKTVISPLLNNNASAKYRSIPFIRCLIKRRLLKWYESFNPDQYNGAYLLGLHGIVIKSHGSANQHAFLAAIKQAEQAARQQIASCIAANFDVMFSQKS